ncbi:TLR4 interactor with leucine rich repeats-like [Cylas formicarius]|uniref:TLR4 interactor with leucine rich repeats-like n=1 Tax=Cylas formicarius TaxID=197179 RepID=UPI002958B7B8|nr:TLR4 interactor with leucine rich repeats-like [Cylas formicarius]XP_060530772.1 TLR4 interactor with leucine rich repeats-like [Cylas formicarius]
MRLFLVMVWISATHASCPTSCNCTDTSLLCIDKRLDFVPDLNQLDWSPLIVDLSGNNLAYIDADHFSFDKNADVKEIYLNNSEIVGIESYAFTELESLQELYLGQNLLNDVSEFIIEPLESMVLLDLSGNYFSGDMPKIRSKSLEVLAVANAKIVNVPDDSLTHLPNLKLLLLQQNNLKSITFDAFKTFEPNSFFMKLSYNSWECSCENWRAFKLLASKNFVDVSEPYQCSNGGVFDDIFGNDIPDKCRDNVVDRDLSNYKEIRAMVDEDRKALTKIRAQEDTVYEDQYLDDMSSEESSKNCSDSFLIHFRPQDDYFVVLLGAVLTSFFLGLVAGLLFCKVLIAFRYRKLEQVSDSRAKLISP